MRCAVPDKWKLSLPLHHWRASFGSWHTWGFPPRRQPSTLHVRRRKRSCRSTSLGSSPTRRPQTASTFDSRARSAQSTDTISLVT